MQGGKIGRLAPTSVVREALRVEPLLFCGSLRVRPKAAVQYSPMLRGGVPEGDPIEVLRWHASAG